jgi:D-alanyl-D-alanine dipeptidase
MRDAIPAGTAGDLTLVDQHGHELRMPTGFDDFTEASAPRSRQAFRQTPRETQSCSKT